MYKHTDEMLVGTLLEACEGTRGWVGVRSARIVRA